LLGLAAFTAVKLLGYTAAAAVIKKQTPDSSASVWLVGGVRTAIGIAVGIGAALAAERLGMFRSGFPFYLLLAPIRICEWLLLLWLFFRDPKREWAQTLMFAVFGTLWSYVLDIPAILSAFAIPGGFWIC
jgi:hypothetical protein